MYLQSLKLLQPMVTEMHSQENTLFDLDLRKFRYFKVPNKGLFVSADGRTDIRTDFGTKLIYHFFSKEKKAGLISMLVLFYPLACRLE